MGRGVDRFDVAVDLVPVLAGGEPKRVADQMNDARLHEGLWPDVADTSGSPLRPSQTTKKASLTPRLRRSVSTLIQNFAPSPPVPAHSPRMSRSPAKLTPIAA
jgi:hypothetical protein